MLMLPTPQLRKAAEDAAKKAASRELPKGEGFVDRVKYYAFKAYYFTLDNMLVVGVSVCLGLIPLCLFCCCRGLSPKEEEEPEPEPDTQVAAAGKEDEDEVDMVEEEVVVDKDEGAPETELEPTRRIPSAWAAAWASSMASLPCTEHFRHPACSAPGEEPEPKETKPAKSKSGAKKRTPKA